MLELGLDECMLASEPMRVKSDRPKAKCTALPLLAAKVHRGGGDEVLRLQCRLVKLGGHKRGSILHRWCPRSHSGTGGG